MVQTLWKVGGWHLQKPTVGTPGELKFSLQGRSQAEVNTHVHQDMKNLRSSIAYKIPDWKKLRCPSSVPGKPSVMDNGMLYSNENEWLIAIPKHMDSIQKNTHLLIIPLT